jgi:hypothetical protein
MGTAFGIGSFGQYSGSMTPGGHSPLSGQGVGAYPQHPAASAQQLQQIIQTLQFVPYQLQQLQQLGSIQQQQVHQLLQLVPFQLQQLQQILQVVPQQLQQLQQLQQQLHTPQLFAGVSPPGTGAIMSQPFGAPFLPNTPLTTPYTGQPANVM